MKNSTLMMYMAVALSGIATCMFTSCNKNDEQPEPSDLTPVITSFSPPEAAEGATVVIAGKNFSTDKSKNEVSINGNPAAVTDAKPTELSITVPADATNGKIIVKVDNRSDTSATDFKVNPTAPAISAISPEKGDVDTEVTITGSRFTSNSKVYFNGTEATAVTFVSKTSLKAKCPSGALNGKLKVTAGSLEAFSATDFWVKPTITSFTPEKQQADQQITINGANFSTVAGENTVKFGTVTAGEVTVMSSTQLKVKVPEGISANKVELRVTVQQQETISTSNFLPLPTITSYTDHGERSSLVTIKGKNLIAEAEVYFKGQKITSFEPGRTLSMIAFKVPVDAESGSIHVKQNDVELEAGDFLVTNLFIQKTSSPYNNNRYRSRPTTFLLGNKIYIGWGYNISQDVNIEDEFVAYDPVTDTWEKSIMAPAGIPGRSYAAAATMGGKVYLGLGLNTKTSTRYQKWYRVDVSTNTWTEMADFPVATFGCAQGIVNNKILVGPGAGNTKTYEFNETGTGSWSEKGDLGIALYHCTSFVLNDQLFFGMGMDGINSVSTFYNINATGNITSATTFPIPGYSDAPTFTHKGKAYVILYADRKLYQYTPGPTGGTWALVRSNLPYNIQTTKTVNDKVYFFDSFENVYEYIPNY